MAISTSLVNFNLISDWVYRCCWMTEFLRASGQISGAQAAAVLLAWNGQIKGPFTPVAATLPDAANTTKESLAVWWNTGGNPLSTRCFSFAQQVLAQFPEQENKSHPCSNWGLLILELASTI